MNQALNVNVNFVDYHPAPPSMMAEVIEGLSGSPAQLPPKYFYDQRGSELFDAICQCPEYYPTRTEQLILKQNQDEICALIGEDAILIEPGSGSSDKVRTLFDAATPQTYVALDISREFLLQSARRLSQDYPHMQVYALCADFTASVPLPAEFSGQRKVVFFPGSSIGNFEPGDAVCFLHGLANWVKPDGGLLIGVDLKKDPYILNAAYNDAAGITAAFNLNVLEHLNRELNADFDVEGFEHHAFYNDDRGRVEMHLRANRPHAVNINQHTFSFEHADSIHTENSYKYTISEFQALASIAGFKPVRVWTDEDALFSVHYMTV